MKINLVITSQETYTQKWPIGEIIQAGNNLEAIHTLCETSSDLPDAWLLWDPELGAPNIVYLLELLKGPGDVWHAGLKLGMNGLPNILNFLNPTFVFNCDVLSDIKGVSWRLTSRCCLVRNSVLLHEAIPIEFDGIEAAMLTVGYRWLMSGVIMFHDPNLLSDAKVIHVQPPNLTFEDELRFTSGLFSRQQFLWSLIRSLFSGNVTPLRLIQSIKKNRSNREFPKPFPPNNILLSTMAPAPDDCSVTVLIATLDRYPYLRAVLDQMRRQTYKPIQIIVISDIMPDDPRDKAIAEEFSDLPLTMMYHDVPGQCSSRNAGLSASEGDYILFIDDDDEVTPDLIENHLKNLWHYQSHTSSGWVNETGALPITREYSYTRASDVFPTNNTMIRLEVLRESGLFDMALNKRQSEDGDLGMRIFLSGALMIYNPQITVFHHHAPSGGLRSHKARVITYSSSRTKLLHRRFPHVSEVYIQKRYFTDKQVHEAMLMSIAGTFAIRGGIVRKFLKFVIALILLPNSFTQMRKRLKGADNLMKNNPQIPNL